MKVFTFYCDESHEGVQEPNTYTVSGFFSDQPTWEEVENRWYDINGDYGVPRFHAQHLNRRSEEYEGWCKCKAHSYSAELLMAVNCEGKRMRAYNCGMHVDAYRNIISEAGRKKLGHPWMACFKSCVAMIAKDMETLPLDDMVSVVVERGSGFDEQAVTTFGELTTNEKFSYRHRLKTCTPASPEMSMALQVADLMAFEYFKRLSRSKTNGMRPPYALILENNDFVEGFVGEKTFKAMNNEIENTICGPGQLVIIPQLA